MLMRKKKKQLVPSQATVSVQCARPPHVCVGFPLGLWFPPTAQRCACEVNGVSKWSWSE